MIPMNTIVSHNYQLLSLVKQDSPDCNSVDLLNLYLTHHMWIIRHMMHCARFGTEIWRQHRIEARSSFDILGH